MNEPSASWRDRMGPTVTERLSSLLVLLDTRYLPLLLLAAPQSYAVFQWLWENSDQSLSAWIVAGLGAAAFEFSYIGSVAWAENSETNDKQRLWIYATALSALGFSILVAIRVYWATEGWWALLHAGFPLVNCIYTVTIHSASRRDLPPLAQAQWRGQIEQALNELNTNLATLALMVGQAAATADVNNKTFGQQITDLQRTTTTTGKETAAQVAALQQALNEIRTTLTTPALTHICPNCGKGFTNASALGGHRSSCKGVPALRNGHGG